MPPCAPGVRIRCQAQPPEQERLQQAEPASTSSSSSSSSSDAAGSSPASVREALRAAEQAGEAGRRRNVATESTDMVATSLTRRFGLAGGLAWVGFLAAGVIGEQVKTRLEVASEAANTREVAEAQEVVTPDGLRYVDLKVGGGAPPEPGYLVVLDYRAYANGQLFEDTMARGKPIVFLYGKRPYAGGMCLGVERALATMRAGGRRRVTIPPELGFGQQGLTLRPTEHVPEKQGAVPPGATLEYELALQRVSIPPS